MRLKRNRPGLSGSKPFCRSVVTLGNFDGLHRGHQALIHRCQQIRQQGEQTVVVSFEPLPQAFFRPEQAPARLSTVYQKLARLNDMGIDLCWLMRFDLTLSQLSAVDFIEQVLVKGLATRHVIVGEDFRFGHKRAGNLELLTALGQNLGFTVETVKAVLADGARISSTAIRQALAMADFAKAKRMLGRAFQMQGHVVRGQQLGRKLGYPTANLRQPAQPSPFQGIFAVYAQICTDEESGVWRAGVASLGRRPTVGGKELLLEVHLFDFAADLYGRRLQVEFVAKLRDEMNFESIAAMQQQMQLDEKLAREILVHQECPQRG